MLLLETPWLCGGKLLVVCVGHLENGANPQLGGGQLYSPILTVLKVRERVNGLEVTLLNFS